MSELTNIHARAAKDLTTPNNLPADPNALDQVKLVAGNFPPNYAGNEALTLGMVKELAAHGREAELEEVFQKLTQEETRAKEVESLLIQNKAEKNYVDSELAAQNTKVNNHLTNQTQTVKAALSQLSTAANKFYPTLAEANADIANVEVNQPIQVGESGENGGLWYKATAGATSLTKSPYDSLTQARSEDSELKKLLTNNDLNINSSIHSILHVFDSMDFEFTSYITKEDNKLFLNSLLHQYIYLFSSTDTKSSSVSNKELLDSLYALPEPNSVVKIYLTTNLGLPTVKEADDRQGTLRIDVGDSSFTCHVKYGVQGSSSAVYPKKNWTFKFFEDEALSSSVKLKLGNILPHDRLVFKSNWIDCLHARQAANYRLWEKLIETRTGYERREIDYSYVGKTGIDALPTSANALPTQHSAILYVNGDFYGIGHIGTGKRRENYNIPKNELNKIQIELGDGKQADFSVFTVENKDIEIVAPSDAENYQSALDRLRSFFAMSKEDIAANIDSYFYRPMMIDYLLFCEFIGGIDLYCHNAQLVTYDGQKWLFNPYDLDTAYGLHFAGTSIAYSPKVLAYTMSASINQFSRTFWSNVYSAYKTDMNVRYAELRNKRIFSKECVYDLLRNQTDRFSKEMYQAEFSKWATAPSLGVTDIAQTMDWVGKRITFLDQYFNLNQSQA